MLFEQYHWKKARAKKQPYEFKVQTLPQKLNLFLIKIANKLIWFFSLLLSGIRYPKKSGTPIITTGLSTSHRSICVVPPCESEAKLKTCGTSVESSSSIASRSVPL